MCWQPKTTAHLKILKQILLFNLIIIVSKFIFIRDSFKKSYLLLDCMLKIFAHMKHARATNTTLAYWGINLKLIVWTIGQKHKLTCKKKFMWHAGYRYHCKIMRIHFNMLNWIFWLVNFLIFRALFSSNSATHPF